MSTPEEFLTDLAKDLIQAEPMDRQKIVRGYARHMEAREEAIRETVAFAMVSTKTEGIMDNGEVFIKQGPLNQTIINIVGYEKFKAMQEAVGQKFPTYNVAGNSDILGEV